MNMAPIIVMLEQQRRKRRKMIDERALGLKSSIKISKQEPLNETRRDRFHNNKNRR